MFEKEAKEDYLSNLRGKVENNNESRLEEQFEETFQRGAICGYNKANEWHFVKDGDLPKEDLRPRTLGYYLTALKHKSYKGFVFEVAYFTGVIFTKGGDILDNVIAWKEIVLPKESE